MASPKPESPRHGALSGKVAIVTGGGRGLGRTMTLALASAGASVIIVSRSNAAALEEEVAREAALATGRQCVYAVIGSVSDEDACNKAVAKAVSTLRALHILVNNAGLGMRDFSERFMTDPVKFWQLDADKWRALIDTNVNGAFLMAKAAAPHMISGGWGRIVNISTNHRTMRRPGFSPYGPSKAALESATAIWAEDLRGTGVTVNSLRPGGPTWSSMIPEILPEDLRSKILPPQVLVAPLLWLCSAESDQATGGRYCASRWDASLPASEAAKCAYQPAGWTEFDLD